jgi:hypothetical protein
VDSHSDDEVCLSWCGWGKEEDEGSGADTGEINEDPLFHGVGDVMEGEEVDRGDVPSIRLPLLLEVLLALEKDWRIVLLCMA